MDMSRGWESTLVQTVRIYVSLFLLRYTLPSSLQARYCREEPRKDLTVFSIVVARLPFWPEISLLGGSSVYIPVCQHSPRDSRRGKMTLQSVFFEA